MGQSDSNSKQPNEEPTVDVSLQLAVIASILTTIANAIGTMVTLEAIEEAKTADAGGARKTK